MKIIRTKTLLKVLSLLGLSGAGLLCLAAPAEASGWEIVITTTGGGTEGNWQYTDWNAFPGTTAGPGQTHHNPPNDYTVQFPGTGVSSETDPYPYVNGHSHIKTTVHATLRWQRNISGGVSDPNDNPPKTLWYVENAEARSEAWRSREWWNESPVDLTATVNNGGSMGGTKINAEPETQSLLYGKRMYGRYLRHVQAGKDIVVLPSRTITADLTVPDCHDIGGQFRAVAMYNVETIDVRPIEPNPDGFPRQYPIRAPQRILNQYVMSGLSPWYLNIPCRVSLTGSDSDVRSFFLPKLSWKLQRPLPNPLLNLLAPPDNGNSFDNNSIYPQFYDQRSLKYVPGLGFDTTDGLPSSNSSFGENAVLHLLNGQLLGVSPIGIFYEPAETTHGHRAGELPGYRHFYPYPPAFPNSGGIEHSYHQAVDTPNWFYYYSESFTAPYGTTIHYRPGNDSAYFEGQDHVHIGNNGSGSLLSQIFAIVPGEAFVRQVGRQTSLGIDTYVRVVTHECTHKRLYEMLHNGSPRPYSVDSDGDGVPDVLEEAVGMNPNNPETISGWKAQYDPDNDNSSDNEMFCRMIERGLQGDLDQDWAKWGLNWGPTNHPPSPFDRNAEVIDPQYKGLDLQFPNAQGAMP